MVVLCIYCLYQRFRSLIPRVKHPWPVFHFVFGLWWCIFSRKQNHTSTREKASVDYLLTSDLWADWGLAKPADKTTPGVLPFIRKRDYQAHPYWVLLFMSIFCWWSQQTLLQNDLKNSLRKNDKAPYLYLDGSICWNRNILFFLILNHSFCVFIFGRNISNMNIYF